MQFCCYSARSSSSCITGSTGVAGGGVLPEEGKLASIDVRRKGPFLFVDDRFMSSGCIVDRRTAAGATGGGVFMLNLANELLILLKNVSFCVISAPRKASRTWLSLSFHLQAEARCTPRRFGVPF